jgi:hypothetical protein
VSNPVSHREKRTFFTHPLVDECIVHLPAALEHPSSVEFRQYLEKNLHQNSEKSRFRYAEYIAHRFSSDGRVNLTLATAMKKYGDSQAGKEILYFEYQRSVPVLQEIAVRWLAELPGEGADRESLVTFLTTRLSINSTREVALSAITTFKKLGKIRIEERGICRPVYMAPPAEAFLYALAVLYPESTMVRVETLTNEIAVRAMLWPSACIPDLLKAAENAGHISKISRLDQYYQFTLEGSGMERFVKLLGELPAQVHTLPDGSRRNIRGDETQADNPEQISLL